jgi:hypothetical protein
MNAPTRRRIPHAAGVTDITKLIEMRATVERTTRMIIPIVADDVVIDSQQDTQPPPPHPDPP